MTAIELRSIDLEVEFNGEPGATISFRVSPSDGKAKIEPFILEVSVPRRGTLDEAVARGFRAIHRLAQALDEKLAPPGGQP